MHFVSVSSFLKSWNSHMSGCCGPYSISQCFHGQQWSYFQPVVVGFGTSPPVCAECVLMREVRHKLMNSGFPSHKSLETPWNLVRRISYLLLTSYVWILLRRVSGKPWFLFSFSLLFLPTSSQMSLFCSYVCGADILRGDRGAVEPPWHGPWGPW